MYLSAAQSDANLKERLAQSRQVRSYAIPPELKPVVKSLIAKGESKKKICLFFKISYRQLKVELAH